MTRVKSTQTISSADLRSLVRLALLLPAAFDLFLHHGGSCGLHSADKNLGSFLPKVHAVSPDQRIHNNHLPRYEQNPIGVQSSEFESCGSPCYGANDSAIESRFEGPKEKNSRRRRAIKIFRSTKSSLGNKITQGNFRVFDKNPLHKFMNSKKEKQTCLREATRFVGGANLSVDADEDPQQQDNSPLSSPSNLPLQANQQKKSILGYILPNSKRFFISEDSEEILRQRFLQTVELTRKISSQAGPSLLTVLCLLCNDGKKDEISLLKLYTLALLGASCGFHLFLHFITLGYALGVTLPLIVALYFYQQQYELPLPTIFHSSITIFWGIRLFAFLAIREYVTWPSLHQKVVEVQAKMKIPFASKMLCWFLYSFFYVSLVASCWSRLLQSSSSSSRCSWGLLGYTGLALQVLGLSLETIADLQKNSFKTRNKLSWCNVGVWKYSTHPNYLGEGLFWWGAFLAHGFHKPVPSILATVGLMTILYVLKGSAKSLSSKQKEKYGQDVDFYQFQRTHNVFGPKQIWSRQQQETVETADYLPTDVMTNNYDVSVSASNDGNAQEINQ